MWRLAYAADGKTLYTAGEDRFVKAWDALKLNELKVYDAQPDTILSEADGSRDFLGRPPITLHTPECKTGHESWPERPVQMEKYPVLDCP